MNKKIEDKRRDKENKFYRNGKTEKSINNVGMEMIGRSIKIKKLQGNTFEIFEEK